MPLTPPPSAQRAHEELLHLLVKVQHLSGKTGIIAEDLAKTLKTHMEKEETLVLPLLGLLPALASKKPSSQSARRASRLADWEDVFLDAKTGRRPSSGKT